MLIKREVIYAEDVEKIFGKRPWQSRTEEIINDNEPKLEDMPEAVKAAQAEHEKAQAEKAAAEKAEAEKAQAEKAAAEKDEAEKTATEQAEAISDSESGNSGNSSDSNKEK